MADRGTGFLPVETFGQYTIRILIRGAPSQL